MIQIVQLLARNTCAPKLWNIVNLHQNHVAGATSAVRQSAWVKHFVAQDVAKTMKYAKPARKETGCTCDAV